MSRCRWCSVQNGSPLSFPLRMSSFSCFGGCENQVQCERPPGLILTCRATGGFISAAPILVSNLLQSRLFLHETPAAIRNEDQITRQESVPQTPKVAHRCTRHLKKSLNRHLCSSPAFNIDVRYILVPSYMLFFLKLMDA